MTAILFDAARAVTFTVDSIGTGGFLQTTTALPVAFGAGAIVAVSSSSAYGLRTDADGSYRLVRYSPGGAEQPIVQNVVEFEVRLYGRSDAPQPDAAGDPWPTYGPAMPLLGVDDARDSWGPGESCTIARNADGVAVPRLATFPSTSAPLPITTAMIVDGPRCPDGSDALRFDADLLRVNAIDLRLRVEAASAVLRGPAGRLFRRPGTERNASRWVPDVEMRLTVRIRNVGR
jgi:hypothetical protein